MEESATATSFLESEEALDLIPRAPECYLGRQPIYDARREIRGYELLCRRNAGDAGAQIDNGDQATAEGILRAFLEIGQSKIPPEQPVFINHTEALLAVGPIVASDRCVIEVLEGVPVNPETIGDLKRLRGLGCRIALDDFVYCDAVAPFVHLADYVKLDLRELSKDQRRAHVEMLKHLHVKIVAEKVESEQEFEKLAGAGLRSLSRLLLT